MQIFMRPSSIFLALVGLLVSNISFATNGYFPHGVGTSNKAMAGAGMALPEEAISIVNNPAVAAFLDDRMDVGVSLFMPNRNYSTFYGYNNGHNNAFSIGQADIDSENDMFVIPEVARTRSLKNDTAFAWAFYMRSGMSTSYKGGYAAFDPDGDGPLDVVTLPGTYGDGTAGLELSQAFADITWARKLGENTSFGVSAVLAAQSLKARGIGGFAKYTETFAASSGAEFPDKLTGNGRDVNYGAGLKLGLHHLFGEHFSFGIMYQSEINISSSGDYADLLAGGGDLDIPAWFRMGVTWQPVDRFSFSIDVQETWYSQIDALGNSFANIYDCPGAGLGGTDLSRCLGGKNGPGFGWKDVPVYSFGTSWDVNDRWTLRAGISASNQPVPSNENTFNILMINLTEVHFTAGFSRKLRNGHKLGFSFMYSEEESIEALNQLDSTQVIRLTTNQYDLQLSYSWGL
jgi:long-chain fatty acid transport protein